MQNHANSVWLRKIQHGYGRGTVTLTLHNYTHALRTEIVDDTDCTIGL